MRSSSIHEIKQELVTLNAGEVTALCLRLARFKKENKELLSYLLFEAQDEQQYIKNTKQEIAELFAEINLSHLYFAKKTLRKILRVINKHSRYSGNKQTDMELRIFFCQRQSTGINKKELDYFSTQGITIIDAGSFNKEEQAFMEKELAERKLKELDELRPITPQEEVERVMPMEE